MNPKPSLETLVLHRTYSLRWCNGNINRSSGIIHLVEFIFLFTERVSICAYMHSYTHHTPHTYMHQTKFLYHDQSPAGFLPNSHSHSVAPAKNKRKKKKQWEKDGEKIFITLSSRNAPAYDSFRNQYAHTPSPHAADSPTSPAAPPLHHAFLANCVPHPSRYPLRR